MISNISFFKDLIEENTEYCGIFSVIPSENVISSYEDCLTVNKFIISDVVKGENLPNRKMCQHKRYSAIIWHTHPTSSKPYPSKEDILKIAKHPSIKISVIFTEWGVWLLTTKSWSMQLDYDEKVLDDLYYVFKNGVSIEKRNIIINKFINKIYKTLKIKIEFYEYEDVGNMCLFL